MSEDKSHKLMVALVDVEKTEKHTEMKADGNSKKSYEDWTSCESTSHDTSCTNGAEHKNSFVSDRTPDYDWSCNSPVKDFAGMTYGDSMTENTTRCIDNDSRHSTDLNIGNSYESLPSDHGKSS